MNEWMFASALRQEGHPGGNGMPHGPVADTTPNSYAISLSKLKYTLSDPRSSDSFRLNVKALNIFSGTFTAIRGPSGCGKTTLLSILVLARSLRSRGSAPSAHQFSMADCRGCQDCREPVLHDIGKFWAATDGTQRITALRRSLLGFSPQSGELLPNLTVQENVAMPLHVNGWKQRYAWRRVRQVLEMLSDDDAKLWLRRRHLPSQLSGGEQQRVALARAIVHKPAILFLDEPTANLDPRTARRALAALAEIQREEHVTIVLVSHDQQMADEFAEFVVEMDSFSSGEGTVAAYRRKNADGQWGETDARWQRLCTECPAGLCKGDLS